MKPTVSAPSWTRPSRRGGRIASSSYSQCRGPADHEQRVTSWRQQEDVRAPGMEEVAVSQSSWFPRFLGIERSFGGHVATRSNQKARDAVCHVAPSSRPVFTPGDVDSGATRLSGLVGKRAAPVEPGSLPARAWPREPLFQELRPEVQAWTSRSPASRLRSPAEARGVRVGPTCRAAASIKVDVSVGRWTGCLLHPHERLQLSGPDIIGSSS